MAHPEPLSSSHDHTHSHKRKRDPGDEQQPSHDRIPQPPPPQSGTPITNSSSSSSYRAHSGGSAPLVGKGSHANEPTVIGNGAHINYLTRNPVKLQLIQGDAEVFSDVLGLIGDYEGVLSRHESLASNLGAKLTGPRLIKAMEGLFEGPITLTQRDRHNASPVTWLDIVQFAKTNPNDFNLTATADRGRYCTFLLNGHQVEITEDDWRLIVSGTVDRFNLAPAQPLDEDENLELATLEILEQRLQVLIKKADEVARKARQLNYHLSGRKAAINSRRTSNQRPSTHSPPTRYAGFTPHNHSQQQSQGSRSASGYDLKNDLLQQFTAASTPLARPSSARLAQNSVSLPSTPIIQQGPAIQPIQVSSRASPAAPPSEPHQSAPIDDPSAAHRPLITARIEKLAKGDTIFPPCDRCRRLRVQCIKHLTACQGCTKKHAKCSWKAVTDEEMAALKDSGSSGTGDGDGDGDDGASRSGGYTPDPLSASSASIVDSRNFAPLTNYHTSSGNGTSRSNAGVPPKDRQVTDFGNLREQQAPQADQFRLSHMASVALNSDTREKQQQSQQPGQGLMARSESVPRD